MDLGDPLKTHFDGMVVYLGTTGGVSHDMSATSTTPWPTFAVSCAGWSFASLPWPPLPQWKPGVASNEQGRRRQEEVAAPTCEHHPAAFNLENMAGRSEDILTCLTCGWQRCDVECSTETL